MRNQCLPFSTFVECLAKIYVLMIISFPVQLKRVRFWGDAMSGKSVHCLVIKTGYDVDVFVGSSLVDMYAKCGDINESRKVFDEMPQRNVVSWSGMIYGYTQLGEHEEAMRLFKEALLEGLDVNDFTLSSVIRVCGSATLLELGKQIHGLCFKTSYDLSGFSSGLESRSRNSIKRLKRGVTFLIHHPTRVIHWYVMVQAEAMWHYFIDHLVTEMIGNRED
ncbi:hypothetical protein OIU84_026408, partial [Salix udensis]